MRTKHLVMALALPTLFAACQDQDYLSNPTNNLKGQFIKLEEGFALQGGYNDVSTRGQWDVVDGQAHFAWRPNQVGATTKYTPDQIGLAWTGVCLDKDGNYVAEGSTLAKADGRVFTNYKFNHFAWKINGEDIVEDKCIPGTYTSGVELVNGYTDGTNTLGVAYNTISGEVEYTATAAAITTWPTYTTTDTEVNGSEGLFNTNNSTVYAGQYIVYAPYDTHNVSNYIVATSKDEFAISQFETETNRAKTLNKFSNEIFKYGNTTIVDGGATTTKFATENLNGYIGIKLTSIAASTIKKVIIYDETGKNLLTKVGLSSSGILENKSGKDIYLDNANVAKEYTQTITAKINGTTGEALTANTAAYVAIPALPTESAIASLKVVLIDDKDMAVEKEFTNITIERNKFANGTWLDFSGIDFTKGSLLATDEASLKTAVAAQNTKNIDGAVKILGNIKLTADYDVAAAITNPIKVTITGGKIILPDNNTSKITLTLGSGVIVNSNIDVMRVCCTAKAGELVVKEATLGGIVNIGGVAADPEEITPNDQLGTLVFSGNKTSIVNGTINNYGIATLDAAASATDFTQVNVNGTINNYATLKIEKAALSSNKDAKLFILDNGTLNNKNAATTTIEGVLAVAGTASNSGVVVDKISSQVTGNIYELASPGEYISEVDNPGERFTAALTARPTTTLKFVGAAQTYDLNKLTKPEVRKTIKTYVVDESGAGTTFNTTSTTAVSASMKNLIVNSKLTLTNGKSLNLKVTETALINEEMIITDMDVTDKDKQCLGAKDLIVNSGGSLAIGKYVRSMMETLTVNPKLTTPAKDAGEITFNFSSQTFVSGLINILGTADILQATSTGGADVAGDVWYKETKPQGAENWKHGIPTKFGGNEWPAK